MLYLPFHDGLLNTMRRSDRPAACPNQAQRSSQSWGDCKILSPLAGTSGACGCAADGTGVVGLKLLRILNDPLIFIATRN